MIKQSVLTGPVLVIGAAGKTGLAVTRALVARGVPVRAAVRGPASYDVVRAAGADAHVDVDLETGAGLAEAMAGAGAVYHLAPNVHPDEVAIAARVVAAADAAGVARLVFHSVLHPHDPAMPHHLRKAEAEAVVRSGLAAWTVLQPAAYHQNLLASALAGRIEVPYSIDAPFTNVDLADVAEAAARVLLEPGHARATYELAGPLTTVRGMAIEASAVLGREVVAAEIDPAGWARRPAAGLPPRARTDLLAMFAAYDARGLAGNEQVLTRLLGGRPRTWRDVLAQAAADRAVNRA
ncbi:MAG TPA: NmrA family NAD(P)-binding protein [Actinomycetes bacterium]|nr:NmrA family NAD(P)-binding protein [Actinomycetes bacterium]